MKKLIILLTLFSNIINADALPEYTLKTAYLYNFALLTDWPKDEHSDDFNICFYKKDFGEASDVLKNKKIHNKKIKISKISSLKKAKECKVVFIRKSEEQNAKVLIQKLLGEPILIVSENKNLTDSHINILQNSNKLAFDVSLKVLRKSDLIVSSRLLKLARKVTK